MSREPEPPRLFLDVQAIQDRERWERGIPRYVAMQAAALTRIPGAVTAIALNPSLPFPDTAPSELLEHPRLVWNTASEFRRAQRQGPIAYYVTSPLHVTQPTEACLPPYAYDDDVTLVCTLYDMILTLFTSQYLHNPNMARFYGSRENLWQHSDLLLSLSEHSARDAMDLLAVPARRLAVIGGGVAPAFRRPRGEDVEHAAALTGFVERPYVLTLTHPDPRKNTESVIRAYARLPGSLRRRHRLVIAGSTDDEWLARLRAEASAHDLDEAEVVITGRVSDEVLVALYQQAEVFVNPSRYEGFGLPTLEAAACGCPSISAAGTSMVEILDWPPSTFPPEDAAALAALMGRALTDPSFRASLREVGDRAARLHTWDRVAARTVAAISAPPVRRRRARRAGRLPLRRVAFIGGVGAGFGEEPAHRALVRALADHVSVDVFTEAGRAHGGAIPGDLPEAVVVMPLAALGRRRTLDAFDLVIEALGPSPSVEEQLASTSGHATVTWVRSPSALVRAHPIVVPHLRAARGIIVDSADAAHELLGVSGGGAMPPILATRPPVAGGVWRGAGLLVVVVDDATDDEDLAGALDLVAETAARVVLVGAAASPIRRRARRIARDHRVSARLSIMSAAREPDIGEWCSRADGVIDATGNESSRVATAWTAWRAGRPLARAGPAGAARSGERDLVEGPERLVERLLRLAMGDGG